MRDKSMESKLTKNQTKTLEVPESKQGRADIHTVTIRYDDQCGNGHNTFSITAEGRDMGGCCHDEVVAAFPHLAKFIKWHLTSSDGPLYYIPNTVYHCEKRDLDAARNCAVWPEATDAQLMAEPEDLRKMLCDRHDGLMESFRADMIELGFEY